MEEVQCLLAAWLAISLSATEVARVTNASRVAWNSGSSSCSAVGLSNQLDDVAAGQPDSAGVKELLVGILLVFYRLCC